MCIKQYDIIVWLSIIRLYVIIMSNTYILFYRGFVFETDKPCGTQSEQGVAFTNIVGGEDARENEFNWMVLINNINGQFCGGTLITKKHVLTAAHFVVK